MPGASLMPAGYAASWAWAEVAATAAVAVGEAMPKRITVAVASAILVGALAIGGGQRRNRGGFGGEPSAAVTALQKAVDDKAPAAEIKAKLKIVQDEAKENQAKLVAAQEDLRSVLTPRQEAIATLRGLL